MDAFPLISNRDNEFSTSTADVTEVDPKLRADLILCDCNLIRSFKISMVANTANKLPDVVFPGPQMLEL